METPKNCVYCHNQCPLDTPKCDKGKKMAKEIAEGTWTPPTEEEMKQRSDGHGHHGGHHKEGHHGEGHHSGGHHRHNSDMESQKDGLQSV